MKWYIIITMVLHTIGIIMPIIRLYKNDYKKLQKDIVKEKYLDIIVRESKKYDWILIISFLVFCSWGLVLCL